MRLGCTRSESFFTSKRTSLWLQVACIGHRICSQQLISDGLSTNTVINEDIQGFADYSLL